MFQVFFKYAPYFYIAVENDMQREVESVLRRKYVEELADVAIKDMWDLDLPNHLAGHKRKMIQLKFRNVQVRMVPALPTSREPALLCSYATLTHRVTILVPRSLTRLFTYVKNLQHLMSVRKDLSSLVERNLERKKEKEGGADSQDAEPGAEKTKSNRLQESVLDHIVDMREYDVPYVMRCGIDNELFVGLWYSVSVHEGEATITSRPDLTESWGRAEPRILAFDIECTKEPLKFPDAEIDSIYMISYMIDGEGFLIVNRQYVSEDIEDFEYTPKKEYEGPFTCFNEENELALLRRFLDHIQEVKPAVFVTYNGDFFDFPFLDRRMKEYGLCMEEEIGIQKQQSEEYNGRFACHLDAFHWVNRDSYLPQGSRGLKAVTKYKLGYDPKEIHPEDMLPYAQNRPQVSQRGQSIMMRWVPACSEPESFRRLHLCMHLFAHGPCALRLTDPTDSPLAGNGCLLGLRCRRNVLPLHAVRPPIHFFALQHYSYDAGRCLAQGIGYSVRDFASSRSVQRQHRLSQ